MDAEVRHVVIAHDPSSWMAVPANNGGNGNTWQWGDELLAGFTCGTAKFDAPGHQVDESGPLESWLARSADGGESWRVWKPSPYPGCGDAEDNPLPQPADFMEAGLAVRVEGNGYHGNRGARMYLSHDRGETWNGPYGFNKLFDHPELSGTEFTGRTAYLADSPGGCLFFLCARQSRSDGLGVSLTDKPYLARTCDGGVTFRFVSWIVPRDDPDRAVMPSPVRLSGGGIAAALRRRNSRGECWIDCHGSSDDGASWVFLSRIGETGGHNGNPPAMIRMRDGRLCCAYGNRDRRVILAAFSADGGKTWGRERLLRDGFRSVNGYPDLGYPRLFQRSDGRLVAVYFWCSPSRPQTHIEATIFGAEER